jgi:hypothetical protein
VNITAVSVMNPPKTDPIKVTQSLIEPIGNIKLERMYFATTINMYVKNGATAQIVNANTRILSEKS